MNYNNGKKAQSSLLVLLLLVVISVTLFLFILFSSSKFQARTVKEIELSKISKYLDSLKGVSRYALLLSSHAASEQVGELGGEVSNTGYSRSWICNFDLSPHVDSVRFFLSEQTLKYLNDYMVDIKIPDLPVQNIENYTCVDYDVDETSVIRLKENDEKFNVGAYGSMLNVSIENDTVTSDNDVYEEIAQVRFWYMYRKFKEWAPVGSEILVNKMCDECLAYVCDCEEPPDYTASCDKCYDTCPKFQECLEEAVEEAGKALEDIFDDEYINCEPQFIGCYHELEDCVEDICMPWEDAPKCRSCMMEEPEELCIKNLFLESNEDSKEKPDDVLYFLDCDQLICDYIADTKGSMEATFSCTDSKYSLSTGSDRYLTFSVHSSIFMKKHNCGERTVCFESNGECICDLENWCGPCYYGGSVTSILTTTVVPTTSTTKTSIYD